MRVEAVRCCCAALKLSALKNARPCIDLQMIVDRMNHYTFFIAELLTVLFVVVFFGAVFIKRCVSTGPLSWRVAVCCARGRHATSSWLCHAACAMCRRHELAGARRMVEFAVHSVVLVSSALKLASVTVEHTHTTPPCDTLSRAARSRTTSRLQ